MVHLTYYSDSFLSAYGGFAKPSTLVGSTVGLPRYTCRFFKTSIITCSASGEKETVLSPFNFFKFVNRVQQS